MHAATAEGSSHPAAAAQQPQLGYERCRASYCTAVQFTPICNGLKRSTASTQQLVRHSALVSTHIYCTSKRPLLARASS